MRVNGGRLLPLSSLYDGKAVSVTSGFLGLKVSGRQKQRMSQSRPPYIARNHIVLLQPRFWHNTPPIIGASKGPISGPR